MNILDYFACPPIFPRVIDRTKSRIPNHIKYPPPLLDRRSAKTPRDPARSARAECDNLIHLSPCLSRVATGLDDNTVRLGVSLSHPFLDIHLDLDLYDSNCNYYDPSTSPLFDATPGPLR